MGTYLKYLFQLVLSPGHGWEDVDVAGWSYREVARRGFYPLTALASVSTFARKIYHPMLSLQELLIDAVVNFMMFFLGYFVAAFMLMLFLGTIVPGRCEEHRCHTFALYCMGLLEVVAILGNLMPITLAITWFLPFYVAIVIWKGTEFMGVDSGNVGKFMLMAVPGVLLPPYLLNMLFSLVLK